jgi:hypothetical protein
VEVGRFVVVFKGGVVAGYVCWRHTTMHDVAWVWWMLAADVNVRMLGGTRFGAPVPWRGVFCKRWLIVRVRSAEVGTHFDFEVGDAGAVGGTNF